MTYDIAVFPSLELLCLVGYGYLHNYAVEIYEAAQLHRPHISQLGSLRLLKLKVSTRETATSVTHHRPTHIRNVHSAVSYYSSPSTRRHRQSYPSQPAFPLLSGASQTHKPLFPQETLPHISPPQKPNHSTHAQPPPQP